MRLTKQGLLRSRRQALTGMTSLVALAPLGTKVKSHEASADLTEIWTLDQLHRAGPHTIVTEGAPALTASPYGSAVQFNGVDDALFIDHHPLVGAVHFTFEALFRPDGGAHAQRWFHLQEHPPTEGLADWPGTRFLFEIRVYGQNWCLDAFVKGPGYSQVLIEPDRLHPLGEWAHVAQTYDGSTYRSFVNGVLQGQAPLDFLPQGLGASSIGCRFNRIDYFKGAVRAAAFSRRALRPAEFRLLQK